MLPTEPKVVLLDEPTRGIDVGAKGEIFRCCSARRARASRSSTSTSEVGEALTASHRIVVMAKGRIVARVRPAHATQEEDHGGLRRSRGRRSTRWEQPTSDRRLQTQAPPPERRRQRAQRKVNLNALLVEGRALIALIVIIVVFSPAVSPTSSAPATSSHDPARGDQRHPGASGMLLVILNGGIDLSVGLDGRACPAWSPAYLLQGVDMPLTQLVAYPRGLGRGGHLARCRHARRAGQRRADRPVQRGAVHRHPRHAVRRPWHRPADHQRPDLHQARRRAGAGQHRLPPLLAGRLLGMPMPVLADGRRSRSCSRSCSTAAPSAAGSTPRAATSARPSCPACRSRR